MNDYAIDSIDLDRCQKTPKIVYSFLIRCDNCSKLPIPQYKSFKDQNKTYCKSCYINNNKLEDVISPNRLEMKILEQVIISCSNPTCDKEFNIHSLNEMIKHEEICGRIKVYLYIIT